METLEQPPQPLLRPNFDPEKHSTLGPQDFLPASWVPIVSVIIYAIFLKVTQLYLKNRPAFVLKWPLFIHNMVLFVISVILTVGFLYEAVVTWSRYGLYETYCGTGNDFWDARMMLWGLVFYYSKFYELIDTVFLAVRKRELSLLHVFHHILLILAGYLQVLYEMYFGWITACINAFVHIFMYYYFAMQCLDRRIWWKEWLTTLQIIQFFVDSASSLPFLYFYFTGAPCRGHLGAWLIANLGALSLIFLFVDFYKKTYKRKKN